MATTVGGSPGKKRGKALVKKEKDVFVNDFKVHPSKNPAKKLTTTRVKGKTKYTSQLKRKAK